MTDYTRIEELRTSFLDIPFLLLGAPEKILKLSTEELTKVPKDCLHLFFKKQIPQIFEKLPVNHKSDSDILLCMPCLAHAVSHENGVTKTRKKCLFCLRQLKRIGNAIPSYTLPANDQHYGRRAEVEK